MDAFEMLQSTDRGLNSLRSNVMHLYSHHQAVKSTIYFVENRKLQP